MPFIQFPVIPQLYDGMAVSATTIDKGHNSGLRYILGESHAPQPASAWLEEHRANTDHYTVCSVFLYHTSLTVRYNLKIRVTVNGQTYYYRIHALDKDSVWRTMKDGSAVNDTNYVYLSADIDIANAEGANNYTANFPLDKIYEWQFQIKTSDGGYETYIEVWGVFCREVVSAGSWQAPHDFALEVSAAAHFNDIRTDINLLRDQLSPIVPFSFCRNLATATKDDNNENAFVMGVYRYRPESLYGVIKVEFEAVGDNFRLYVRLIDSAGNNAKVYESANIASTGHDQVVETAVGAIPYVDLTAGDAAAAITAAGITLTFGSYYRLIIGIQRQAGGAGQAYAMEFGAIARTSSGTPHKWWYPLEEWAEGDTDFGPSHLNKMRLNLLQFYTGGTDVMWGESPCTMKWYPTISTRVLSTVHRKRWLVYHVYSGTDPIKVWYGDDYDDSFELPVTSGWLNKDLTELPIPWGSYYHITGNCDGAFECDEAYG